MIKKEVLLWRHFLFALQLIRKFPGQRAYFFIPFLRVSGAAAFEIGKNLG